MYDTVRGGAQWLQTVLYVWLVLPLMPGVINRLWTWAKGIFQPAWSSTHSRKISWMFFCPSAFFFNWISEPCYYHSSCSSSSSSWGFIRSLLVLRGVCRSSLKRRREGERRSACTFLFSSFACGLDQCSGSVWTGEDVLRRHCTHLCGLPARSLKTTAV